MLKLIELTQRVPTSKGVNPIPPCISRPFPERAATQSTPQERGFNVVVGQSPVPLVNKVACKWMLHPKMGSPQVMQPMAMWVWLKIKQEGLRRFWSMFPLSRVPFGYRFFEPQPCVLLSIVFCLATRSSCIEFAGRGKCGAFRSVRFARLEGITAYCVARDVGREPRI